MPHLRVRGLPPAQVQELSSGLCEELALIINTSADNFTVELIATQYFGNGQSNNSYPFIEVLWFQRPQDVKQRVAEHLTERVKRLLPSADVVVVFHVLEKTDYFENGKHF